MRFVMSASALVVVALLSHAAEAQPATPVPQLLNHEGLLRGADGLPMDDPVVLRLTIHDVPEGGLPLWTEQYQVQPVEGYYRLTLGLQDSLEGIFDAADQERYLGISIDGDPQLSPRHRLLSVPWALVANNVVGDITPTSVSVGGKLVIDANGDWVGDGLGGGGGGGGGYSTPAEVLAALRLVDGPGSDVNADLFDGLDSAAFPRTGLQILGLLTDVDGSGSLLNADRLDDLDSTAFLQTGQEVLDELAPIDGPGSGLDADLLDGVQGSRFMRADQDTGTTGSLTVSGALLSQGTLQAGQVRVAPGARVGVGVADPAAEVHVDGTVRANALVLDPQAGAPADPTVGTLYLDAGSGSVMIYDGAAWAPLASGEGGGPEPGDEITRFGNGTDGPLLVAGPSVVVNRYTHITGNVAPGSAEIPVAAGGLFRDGMEVLVIQMQGPEENAGTHEFRRITEVRGNTLVLAEPLDNIYLSGAFDGPDARAAQVVWVPNYTTATIIDTLTAPAWNGFVGGVVAFRAAGAVQLQGSIDVSGRGFRGGPEQPVSYRGGYKGESWGGRGASGPDWYTSICSGTINNPNPTRDQAGPNGGGGSGGYGGCHGGGGGGGVYGGLPMEQCGSRCDPPGDQRGWGAPECGRPGYWAMPGDTYGAADLRRISPGSGGGSGNSHSASPQEPNAGGAGGGIVMVFAETINVAGNVLANGSQGQPLAGTPEFEMFETTNTQDGSGGAGSGGAITLSFLQGDLGEGRVQAVGGPCGARAGWDGPRWETQRGANGGLGRIRLEYSTATGSTTPRAFYRDDQGLEGALVVAEADTVVNFSTPVLSASVPAGSVSFELGSAAELTVGDEVLIIQMQHPNAAGVHEFAVVASLDGARVTVATPLTNTYSSGTFESQSAVAAQLVRVPHYTTVTVQGGASLTCPAWDGYRGGVVAFRATGDVVVHGSITASAKGFRGGPQQPVNYRGGYQGESWTGLGRHGPDWYTSICQGTINNPNPTDAQAGPNAGGGSGGYGGCHGGGGGGGVYGALPTEQCGTACDPGGDQRGWGAPECGRAGYWAKPGIPYGTPDLGRMYLGSGGGSGNSHSATAAEDNHGGAGGGIVFIEALGLQVQGGVRADGEQGWPLAGTPLFAQFETTNTQDGSGGAGSGGSVRLQFVDGSLGDGRVTANGGACGARTGWPGAYTVAQRGANGGAGRVRLDYGTLDGSTSPAYYSE